MSKKQLKIGLLSHHVCSSNLGVSALTLSNISILNNILKKLNIKPHYVLFSGEGPKAEALIRKIANFEQLSLEPAFQFKRKPRFFREFFHKLKECDLILDTCGGDSFADIYGIKRYLNQTISKWLALKTKKPLIFTPQTIGPFKSKMLRRLAGRIMNQSEYIFTRDQISYDYAKGISSNQNIRLVTDMAMLLPYDKTTYAYLQKSPKFKLGINISGLVANGGYNGQNQFQLKMDYPDFVEKLIKKYYSDQKVEIHLIPHVITENRVESDNHISHVFQKRYPELIVAPQFENPMEAKSYIAQMDVFVGTRMHATIAAISSGVPVIPVAYSRKFEGLFSSINYEAYINATEVTADEAVKRIQTYLDDLKGLAKMVEESQQKINYMLEEYHGTLKNILGSLVAPAKV